MKKKLFFSFLFICLTILAFGAISASAATYGDLTYEVWDDEVTITDCNTAATEVNIPEKINGYPVTSIGDSAFYKCTSLATITIGDSVTSIGDDAFKYCDSLVTVTIPDSVTSIGSWAFYSCDSLATVTIPDSVTSIGYYAFEYCDSLASVTIPDSVTSIGSYAFSNCDNLATITIGDSVTSIGNGMFARCVSLATITIGDSVTSIGNSAFYSCDSLVTITIPDSVTSIGNSAFKDCDSLATITIPDSVTSIGDDAFYDCYSLFRITIGDSVTSIGNSAFYNCDRLIGVTIGDSVTSIGDDAFYSCDSLATVTIPDSVTSIGSCAFYSCDSLATVTIGDSVTSIGDDAFYDCYSLSEVHITDMAAWCRIDFSGSDANPLWYANNLYLNGALVTKLTIPDGVEAIKPYAFEDCDSLVTVTIGDGVTSIGDDAFKYCDSLATVTIGDSVTSIGSYAFYSCDSLSEVHITDMAAWCRIDFGSYANPLYRANNLYLNGALVTELTIPDSVTSIGDYAFDGCDSLVTVTIGDSVTSIGDGAFSGCTSLATVTIPDSVTSIGYYAFEYCDSLASVTIPDSVTSIRNQAFSYCDGLSTVHITDMAAWCRIDFGGSTANPLYYANKLYLNGALVTELTIPDSVTSIGRYAFYSCDSLASVTIPDSVTSIGDRAFEGCTSLATVTIGKGVTMIPEKAFYDCGNLQSVCLPAELLYIRNDAFNSCPNIQTVFYAGSEAEWNSISKNSGNENLTNADIIYQAKQKTYRFVTNCESTIPAITDYAVFVSPAVENENATFLGWFDNEALSGAPVSFPYYGKATTLYAAWMDGTDESFDDAFILKADRDYPVTISESGQLVYYQFVPTMTKNYRFYSTGSLDTYGYLYNKNQSCLTSDDDSGVRSNFSFTYHLTAGETYYIAVKLYSGTGSFTLVSETLVDYKLGGITIKDASGEVLSSIPKGEFFATVSVSNVCATEDSIVVLAQYTDTGAFRGVKYASTEDLPQGSTINVTIPINNANGDVAQLKAFVWESFTSMTPVGVPVVFPAE